MIRHPICFQRALILPPINQYSFHSVQINKNKHLVILVFIKHRLKVYLKFLLNTDNL